ncbi:MAG: helix-turn-helix domain-containing protein [Bacteroidales bacterium]|jgi:AraC-like DNA-binding protein
MIQSEILKISITLVSVFLSFPVFPANELILTEERSFQYVYLETREPYAKHDELMRLFNHECIKQNLQKYIAGNMLTIYLDDNTPVWRIAFELNTPIQVDRPLKIDSMQYTSGIIKHYTGSDIQYTIQILQFHIREMELHQTGPTMIQWTEIPELSDPSIPEIDIIIPTCSIDSASFLMTKISRYLVLISIALFVLLGIMALCMKAYNKISKLSLSLFLFSSALVLSGWIVGAFRYTFFTRFPSFYYIAELFSFLPAPLLFLYIRSLIKRESAFSWWNLLHYIPFAVVFILWIGKYYIQPAEIKRLLILSEEIFPEFLVHAGIITLNAQIIGYIVSALILMYVDKFKNRSLNGSRNRRYAWLSFVLWGFLITAYIANTKHFLYNYIGVYSDLVHVLRITSNLVFVIVLFYKGMLHPYLLTQNTYQLSDGRKPSLSKGIFEQYRDQLIKYMVHHRPYLIPEITLTRLSEMTSIPPRSLSEVINKGFQQNFFEFVNSYRIEEAKKMIRNSDAENKTILEILYEVGFNNKSVFNATFKKHTGKTPTEYKLEKVS